MSATAVSCPSIFISPLNFHLQQSLLFVAHMMSTDFAFIPHLASRLRLIYKSTYFTRLCQLITQIYARESEMEN